MPELPEVEVVRQGLQNSLFGKSPVVVQKIQTSGLALREAVPLAQIRKLLPLQLDRIDRRAKYLIFESPKGGLVSHLGMTGNWRIERSLDFKKRNHDHVILQLENGEALIYNDPRRFGIFHTTQSQW